MKKVFFVVLMFLVGFSALAQTPSPTELSVGIGSMVMTPYDSLFNGLGFSLSAEGLVNSVYANTSLYLLTKNEVWSTIVDLAIGYTVGNFYWAGIYGGLGVGITFAEEWLSGKINGGIILGLGYLFMKIDTSYGTILGPTIGIGFGFFSRGE